MVPLSSHSTCDAVTDNPIEGYEVEFPSMGSLLNVRWYDGRPAARSRVLSLAKSVAQKWNDILSDYEPESEASLAAQRAEEGVWVPVSPELWETIQACDFWHRQSQGAFDAALGAWTRLRRKRKPPSSEQWNDAKSQCGWQFVDLDPIKKAFRLTRRGVRFDFGAIGKGLVADKIADALRQDGISSFVVNAAGNMCIGDAPESAHGWPVAIDVPPREVGEESAEFAKLRLSRCGIATSGDRWQRYPNPSSDLPNTDPIRTSHIVDPKTLRGVTAHHSVTVVAASAADADAIATITSVRTQSDLPGWLEHLESLRPSARIWLLERENTNSLIRLRFASASAS
jgi:thiamine biosynthesis lipoprotein